MGLDMYLMARQYVGGWRFTESAEKRLFDELVALTGMRPDEGSPHFHVKVCVAYWRKSNQIHRWFVQNCQNGQDDCRDYYVSREQVQELVKECRSAIESKDASNLPTQSGFFFGSTEVDGEYWGDLERTVTMLQGILDNPAFEGADFEYHSSW